MKRTLIVGLGNVMVPEDAAGVNFVRALAQSRIADGDIETIEAGIDLLRAADHLKGRDLIVLVDAADVIEEPTLIEHGSPQFDNAQLHAHHLSAVEALELIRWSDPDVGRAACVWLLVPLTWGGAAAI